MSTRNRITTTILATLLSASALGSVALASSLDASQLQAIRVSAEQALVTAELQVQGSKAVELELEQGQQQAYYEVKLLGADSKHEVKIDAVDGAVLSTRDKQASGAANKLQGVKVSAAQAASNAATSEVPTARPLPSRSGTAQSRTASARASSPWGMGTSTV